MKIAIISDSHDNVPNIDKALEHIESQGIEHMIHCGDVCAPGVFEHFAKNFTGELHVCFGNVDGDRKKSREKVADFPNVTIHGERGSVNMGGLKIGFVHYPDQAREMAASDAAFDYVCYGHDHRAWEEQVGDCKILNPGTLAGLFAKATFAILDTNKKSADLVLVDTLWAK